MMVKDSKICCVSPKTIAKAGVVLTFSAVTAFSGALLLYYCNKYFSGEGDGDDGAKGVTVTINILDRLRKAGLDEVKRNELTQDLDPKYFCELLNFLVLISTEIRHDEITAATSKRREAFKSEDWTSYRNIVEEMQVASDEKYMNLLEELIKVLPGLS